MRVIFLRAADRGHLGRMRAGCPRSPPSRTDAGRMVAFLTRSHGCGQDARVPHPVARMRARWPRSSPGRTDAGKMPAFPTRSHGCGQDGRVPHPVARMRAGWPRSPPGRTDSGSFWRAQILARSSLSSMSAAPATWPARTRVCPRKTNPAPHRNSRGPPGTG